MKLLDKNIAYEKDCRQIFVGQIIRDIIYGELKYYQDEDGTNINPEPYYKTKYPDIDTLDHSIYLKIDNKTIYVYWDNTFISYGLAAKLIDLKENTNDYEQKWNVSEEPMWKELIGRKIIDFNILWEETWTSNLDGSNKTYTTYPQTFEIKTDNNKTIILSASEFKQDEENEIYSLMDNILVTTNIKLAKNLMIIK